MPRILIAHSNSQTRFALDEQLTSEGYDVYMIDDGSQVIPYIAERQIDLLILGFELSESLTICRDVKEKFRSGVWVLLLSEHASIEDRLGGFEAGADDFLADPSDPRELPARVYALLRQPSEAPGNIFVVWDPMLVDPEDYSTIVKALGDLVRSEGGIGISRLRDQGFSVPVSEVAIP